MKKGYVMFASLILIFIMSMLIGYFMKYSQSSSANEFFKELTALRCYWAVFGAKEIGMAKDYNYYSLRSNGVDIQEEIYRIEVSKNVNSYSYKVIQSIDNQEIKNIHNRILTVDGANNKIQSYKGQE